MLKVKAARKAPNCYGGGREEDGHGWEYLCESEWEGERSDSWVWHDKMASVEYALGLWRTTWNQELRLAQCVRWKAASFPERHTTASAHQSSSSSESEVLTGARACRRAAGTFWCPQGQCLQPLPQHGRRLRYA